MAEGLDTPTCLVFAGHDPSGGAGIQADIETLASMGCHAATLVTCLTVQDTRNVYSVQAACVSSLVEQAGAVLADMPVQAVKIGLIANAEMVRAIHTILAEYPDMPVVLDPVICAGGGRQLQDAATGEAMRNLLFPLTTVLTPNIPEARTHTGMVDTPDACGMALLEYGCEFVLISGGHEQGEYVVNRLFSQDRSTERFLWPRLAHEYHGSGCTLSAAVAGLLARGHEPHSAVREAQQYTWESLAQAYPSGAGQLQPQRFYWAHTMPDGTDR